MSNELSISGYVYGCKVDAIPSQVECSIVGYMHCQKDVHGLMIGYFQTIYRLMLAGFCLAITIGCATHDDLASLKYSLRATDATVADHTTALAAIKASIEAIEVDPETSEGKEVILVENEPQSVPGGDESHSAITQPDATTAVRLFVTHAPFSCPPCDALDEANARGDLDGFEVVLSGDFEGLASYPAIRFRHKSSATGWAVRYGWSDGQLDWLKANLLPAVVRKYRITEMPHSEMKALHDSLHGGGSWSWPGDLAEHLRTTHGVPVDVMDQNHRESAVNGPRVSVRSAVHWSRFVGRSRNSYRQSCPPGRKS